MDRVVRPPVGHWGIIATPSPRDHSCQLGYLVDELEGTVLDDPIAADGVLALVESMRILPRWARRPWEITEDRIAWLAQLLEVVTDELGRDDLRALWTYVVSAFPPGSPLRQPLLHAARPTMPQEFISIYDEAVAKGRTKGLAKGRTKGLSEGRRATQAELLLRVLEHRGLSPSAAQRRRINRCTDDALLRRWLARSLSAPTIQEVLAR